LKRVRCGYRDRNDFRRSVRARRNKEAIAREINVVNAFAGAMEMLLDRRRRYFTALEGRCESNVTSSAYLLTRRLRQLG